MFVILFVFCFVVALFVHSVFWLLFLFWLLLVLLLFFGENGVYLFPAERKLFLHGCL